MSYGLHFFDAWGDEFRLEQIGGGGRVKLKHARRGWELWKRPPDVHWQVYETEDGQTYPSREDAEAVAVNLTPSPTPLQTGGK